MRALLRQIRKERYQDINARMAPDLGITAPAISQILTKGKNKPSYQTAARLAKLANVDLGELLSGTPRADRSVETELPPALQAVMSRPRSEGGRRGEWTELTVQQVAQAYAYGGAELTDERAIQLGDSYQNTTSIIGVRAPVADIGAAIEAEIAKRKKRGPRER